MCCIISNERAGCFAACLYNASFYAGITAGIFVMPDSPQMIFWTWSLWMIASILKDESNWKNWILFGISTGLCIMSKVHGVFIWVGIGLYILIYKRNWFANPYVIYSCCYKHFYLFADIIMEYSNTILLHTSLTIVHELKLMVSMITGQVFLHRLLRANINQ